MPKRLCFTRIEDRVVLLSEVEASGFYAPLEYGMKGKLIAQMQQNLKQHRSDTFPHGATTSSKIFETQVDKELMSYQERLQGKGRSAFCFFASLVRISQGSPVPCGSQRL